MLQDAGRRHEPPLSPYSSPLTSGRSSSLGPPNRNNSTSTLDKTDARRLPQRMQPALRREPHVRRRCKRHLAASVAQSEVLCVEGSRPRLPAAAGLLIGHCMENGLVSGFSWLRWILFFFFQDSPPTLCLSAARIAFVIDSAEGFESPPLSAACWSAPLLFAVTTWP